MFLAIALCICFDDPKPQPIPPVTPPAEIVELSPRVKDDGKQLDPTSIDVGRFRWFSVKNYSGPVTWEVQGETFLGFRETTKATTLFGTFQGLKDPDFVDVPAGAVILYGRAKGEATLHAFGVVDGKAKRLVSKSFVVDGGAPQPPPTPKPGPVDPPAPTRLTIVIVTENEEATANRSALFADTAIAAKIHDKGHTWRVIDKDIKQFDRSSNSLIVPPELAGYIAESAGKELPYIVIADAKTGKKLASQPISKNIPPAELLSIITKFGG